MSSKALANAIAAVNALELAPADHLRVMAVLDTLCGALARPAAPKAKSPGATPKPRKRGGHPIGEKTEAAIAFLRSSLRDGPKTAAEINAAANRAGIEPNALGRARVAIGVEPRHLGNGIRGAEGIELTLPEHRASL